MRIKVCELIEMLKKIDSETSIEISSDLEKILCFSIYDNRRPLSGADLDKLLKEHWSFPRLPEETDEKYMERFNNHIGAQSTNLYDRLNLEIGLNDS